MQRGWNPGAVRTQARVFRPLSSNRFLSPDLAKALNLAQPPSTPALCGPPPKFNVDDDFFYSSLYCIWHMFSQHRKRFSLPECPLSHRQKLNARDQHFHKLGQLFFVLIPSLDFTTQLLHTSLSFSQGRNIASQHQ